MRKVNISFGTTREAGTTEINEVVLAQAEKESRWQLGNAVILGVTRAVERRKQLDEWIYRLNGTLIDPKCIESYQANEYMEWRDK